MAKIHLVEDDAEIRRLVTASLAGRGHDVESTATALDGLREIVATSPDVVILDLGLPDLDGRELLRMLRAVSQVPVIVATARDQDASAISLLDSGADDYIVKPYSVDHLEARIRAVLRRGAPPDQDRRRVVGGLVIDPDSREARLDGSLLDLSPKEFDLLFLLADRSGQVISKREMMAQVWREPYGGADRTVDVHLSTLRKKLGETASAPRYLHTVHGVGIKLVES
ncbi:MAG TPA: response regulator transcription factor [Acidimicrobiia bacterium]